MDFLLDLLRQHDHPGVILVGQNIPVLAYTGEGTSMYLTGYDQTHVRVYHPESGATEVLSMETANQVLGAAGYDFICCVPTYRFRSLRKTLHFSQICYNHNENKLGRMRDSSVPF